jgi:hypothetical protein
MYIKIIMLALATFLLAACDHVARSVLAPETIYNSEGQLVISSVINEKQGTISIIYGNESALNTANQDSGKHFPGELFTMVTWKQKPMPHWYGTDMNGKIQKIETVKVVATRIGESIFEYNLENGPAANAADPATNQTERIALIVNARAVVFP